MTLIDAILIATGVFVAVIIAMATFLRFGIGKHLEAQEKRLENYRETSDVSRKRVQESAERIEESRAAKMRCISVL